MPRLIGISMSPMVGSIYNMGVWDEGAAAWVNVDVHRTLELEATARSPGRCIRTDGSCLM